MQWFKDLALSLYQFRLLLWPGFGPWPGNFHMLWAQPKKKKDLTSENGLLNWQRRGNHQCNYGIVLLCLSSIRNEKLKVSKGERLGLGGWPWGFEWKCYKIGL